ncbi:class I mannose-6-phosphate isomerase [Herbiconiux sp. UC225_62]|uniref:class I mannose-6-phosphate isomerase n=1 Tax=Herbiconiux sp. UC225_62 TaxID=3350168 RepID=UPI0036D3A491
MKPAVLAPNLIDHFYRGGDRIARLRGIEQTSDFQPEEWLAATVSRADQGDIGLARTEGGELLRDLVAADPAAWVGPDHADAASASDTGILVKLLDARQRLPVHVHPSRAFAASHLDCPYGKTEAWFVLDAEPGSAVHVGWKEAVDRDELDRRRDAQDSEWMLSRMNRIEVSRGMGVLVPAGTVHAIDAGIFVAEVQEPTDFSIVLEWSITTSTREESHLGLGFDAVMPAVSTDALGADALAALVSRSDLDARSDRAESMLAPAADPYFRVLHAAPSTRGVPIAAGFSVVLVLAGDGVIAGDAEIPVHSGQVLAVPAGFGAWEVRGPASVLVATPGAGWPRSLAEGAVI